MKDLIYVVIGASAGGLKALEKLIEKILVNNRYVYIITQHLNPDKKSLLLEILSKHTSMNIVEIKDNPAFLANHIYIMPPNFHLEFQNQHLVLKENSPNVDTRYIDKTFEAVSLLKKENCIGIILTGAGMDGTIGVKKIKENGGTTIAQSPTEAYQNGMPKSAIDSGNIDFVLNLQEIVEYLNSRNKKIDAKSIRYIQKILKKQEKLDIDKYKDDTILRRINKRMILANLDRLDKYIQYIKDNPQEVHLLYQDILIGVTAFFRDKDAFAALEKKLLGYLRDKPDGYNFRAWSMACSSGEEAYSLAILLNIVSKKIDKSLNLHLFATDIDEKALDIARKACYPNDLLKNIDEDILNEYFIKIEDGYIVKRYIRDQVIFTNHNLLNDPPFIKQDLISCRNFLIYIKPQKQQEIFSLFHYCLNKQGILFLGSSESTMLSSSYFITVDSTNRIYKKESLKSPPKISNHYFSKHLEIKNETNLESKNEIKNFSIEEKISSNIFDFFSENIIIVNKDFTIIYKKGEIPFLQLQDGFTTLNIIDNIDKTLKYDIKSLLNSTFSSHSKRVTSFIEINLSNSKSIFVKAIAFPFENINNDETALLYFQILDNEELRCNSKNISIQNETTLIKNLTRQIDELKFENHFLLDQLASNKENMQLLNEELQSSNEELQSSNEELETSNEELKTSNEELHNSIARTENLRKQLSLILNSTLDGMIGLDLDGNSVFVNSAAIKMLGFKEDELIGKNAHNLWHHTREDGSNFPVKECPNHNAMLNGISTRGEDLYWRKNGTSFEVEFSQNPMIANDKIIGTVISFHDITQRNRLKRAIKQEHQLSDIFMNAQGTIVVSLNLLGNITMINQKGAKFLGYEHDEILGKNWFDNFIRKENMDEIKNVFKDVTQGDKPAVSYYKNPIIDRFKKNHMFLWTNSLTKDTNDKTTGLITMGIDITQEDELSKKLFKQEEIYKLTFEEANIGIAHISFDGRWIDTNEYLTALLGYTKEEFQSLHVFDITHRKDAHNDEKMFKLLTNEKIKSYHTEKRYIHKNGSIIWVNVGVVLLKDTFGKPMQILKIIRDISEIKLLLYKLEVEQSRLEDIIEFSPISIMLYDKDGNISITNKVFCDTLGYSKEKIFDTKFLLENIFRDKGKIEMQKFFQNALTASIPQKRQEVFFTKSKEKKVGIFNSVLLHKTYNDNKKVVLCSIIDITELQNKEDLLIAQSRQAAMGDMLSMIAHQWRQPLSVISMVSNTMHAQLELNETIVPEELYDHIKTLDKQTGYLSQTIDDFRNFFKPDREKEEVEFNYIFNRILPLVEKSLQNANINLKLPKKNNIALYTYPNQLIQVLLNIINNSKDAIKENQIEEGTIEISLQKNRDGITIKICDNGGGISSNIIDKLGQPYVSTKSKNGTGLGIYMSNVIVSKHLEGKLSWESKNKNTCFYIRLPYEKESK